MMDSASDSSSSDAPGPTSQSPQDLEKPYLPGQVRSLESIALQSFVLGAGLALGAVGCVAVLALTSSPLWRVPFFVAAVSVFHFLEFWTTARYNTRVVKASSFLITSNWPAYQLAQAAAALECVLTQLLFPRRSWAPLYTGHILLLLGLILVTGGQVVRSAAMAQAGASFNHTVQRQHRESHVLVVTGLYGAIRHPAYFGFFWWAIGTQLVLGNVVCTAAYAAVLWTFFSGRIREEEDHLVRFFNQDYIDYRKRVGTKIPFIH